MLCTLIRSHLKGTTMLITEILARNARMYGDEVALIEREPARQKRVQLTWQEFDDHANQVGQALIARGIR